MILSRLPKAPARYDPADQDRARAAIEAALRPVPPARNWVVATGTADRGTFDTATVTLEELAQRMKALIDDLTSRQVLGA